jgi:hypothetical protein
MQSFIKKKSLYSSAITLAIDNSPKYFEVESPSESIVLIHVKLVLLFLIRYPSTPRS